MSAYDESGWGYCDSCSQYADLTSFGGGEDYAADTDQCQSCLRQAVADVAGEAQAIAMFGKPEPIEGCFNCGDPTVFGICITCSRELTFTSIDEVQMLGKE